MAGDLPNLSVKVGRVAPTSRLLRGSLAALSRSDSYFMPRAACRVSCRVSRVVCRVVWRVSCRVVSCRVARVP